MLIPNGLLARANMKIRARVQSRALAADPIASGRLAADPIASDPEEGSIALLIVGMLALLLLIGSVTVAITGAYLQTQHLQDVAAPCRTVPPKP